MNELKKHINPIFWVRIALMIIVVSVGVIVVFNQQKSDESQVISDEQITAAFFSAREAMEWFELTTMPIGRESDPNMPVEAVPVDEETGGVPVYHSTIKTYNDLKSHLQSLFSDKMADDLLSSERYFDKDGELYTIPADRGSDIGKGEETHEIIRENDKKIIYRIMVENLSYDDFETVVGYSVHDMICEYIGDKWVFTVFELIR